MRILQEAVVDEDEYLRFRITERFSLLMKSLFEAHKKDALPEEQTSVLNEIMSGFQTYQEDKRRESAEKAKMILPAKQLGLWVTLLLSYFSKPSRSMSSEDIRRYFIIVYFIL